MTTAFFPDGDRAACRSTDPDLFFDGTRTLEALAVCAVCPVMAECRQWAEGSGMYDLNEVVVGGLSASMRANPRTCRAPGCDELAVHRRAWCLGHYAFWAARSNQEAKARHSRRAREKRRQQRAASLAGGAA